MTRILSLGQNNGITIMILNLAPLRSYHLDTLSSLNVSSRAKRIEVREIENEVVFTQLPRKTAPLTGTSIQRQPLRPLANAHNTQVTATSHKNDKPAKAFSVYSDRSKITNPRSSGTGAQALNRSNSNKRPSDSTGNSRPTKMARHPPAGKPTTDLTASKIEIMIEKKVQEMLANRVLDQPSSNPPVEIPGDVQRRLEALEEKIENNKPEDPRNEGLHFLFMARQHKERGEDISALKMYELATPFFPGQQKLQKKIDSLRAKIQAKKEESLHVKEEKSLQVKRVEEILERMPAVQEYRKAPSTAAIRPLLPTPPASFEVLAEEAPAKIRKRAAPDYDDYDGDFNGSAHGDYEDDESFTYQAAKPKKPKTKAAPKSTIHIFSDVHDAPSTPRTRHLLDIVNSRNLTMIKGLAGVGAKKARDLVEFLELQNEEEGGDIVSLQQLVAVPGLGKKTVEKAYEGIAALLV